MRFENTGELAGAEFVNVDLSGTQFQNVNLSGARVREALLANARFSGMIDGLVINDVEVAPLIHAELDRRYPERAKLRPDDAEGVRAAWSVVEDLWAATTERARALPEETLHARVDDEWSYLETVRHLIFVTDLWVVGPVLGQTVQHHRFAMPPSFLTEPEQLGIDMTADPSFAEVAPVREERMGIVRNLVADLDDEGLRRSCGDQTVLSCLHVLFNEEWHHHWYATRDLDVLTPAASNG